MSYDVGTRTASIVRFDGEERTLAGVLLIAATVAFLVGGALVIETDTPPSESPVLGMLAHALWALAMTLLALGVGVLLRYTAALRVGLAGYLSAGAFGLGVLHGLNWVTWAYVDIRGAREGGHTGAEHQLLLDSIVVPFGAAHLLGYAILFGAGIATVAWALARTDLVSRYVGVTGIGLGVATVVLACGPLLAAVGGGSAGHFVFDLATLLLPVGYLWVLAVGVACIRSRGDSAA